MQGISTQSNAGSKSKDKTRILFHCEMCERVSFLDDDSSFLEISN